MTIAALITGSIGPQSSIPLLLTGGLAPGDAPPSEPIGGGWWVGPKPEDPYRSDKDRLVARDVQMHKNRSLAAIIAIMMMDD